MAPIGKPKASSLLGKIAFGPNAGKHVQRIGGCFGYDEKIPLAKGHLSEPTSP